MQLLSPWLRYMIFDKLLDVLVRLIAANFEQTHSFLKLIGRLE